MLGESNNDGDEARLADEEAVADDEVPGAEGVPGLLIDGPKQTAHVQQVRHTPA